jgi:hypothetical protein
MTFLVNVFGAIFEIVGLPEFQNLTCTIFVTATISIARPLSYVTFTNLDSVVLGNSCPFGFIQGARLGYQLFKPEG